MALVRGRRIAIAESETGEFGALRAYEALPHTPPGGKSPPETPDSGHHFLPASADPCLARGSCETPRNLCELRVKRDSRAVVILGGARVARACGG